MTYLCSPGRYEFRGAHIEMSGIGGPWAVKDSGDPYIRLPRYVSEALDVFWKLPEEEWKQYRVGGGCIGIPDEGDKDD